MRWNQTEWGNRPDHLMRIFSPINNDEDVMTQFQLAEDRDLLQLPSNCGSLLSDFKEEKINKSNLKQSATPWRTSEENVEEVDDGQLQNLYSEFEVDESDNSRKKRARKSTLAVAAAAETAATVAADSDHVSPSKPGSGSGKHRRLWVKDRSKGWWEERNRPDFPDEEFKRDFRMTRATFDMICEELEPAVMKKNTMLRDAIPVRLRVAVCIWRLGTGEQLRLVSKRFGLGISTCHKLVLEVCTAIRGVLMPKFLKWPDENNMKRIKQEFECMTGIPNVGGSMYTTHIPIIAPKVGEETYLNQKRSERMRKACYSITLQGVVDQRGVFADVCIGWPGSMSDDQVLEKSALYYKGMRGLFKDVWVVRSERYHLMDWVLVPYTHHNLTLAQHGFNEKIGEIEKVAKDAFTRLKGRRSCLQKRAEINLQDVTLVLGACCVLHNICEMRNEDMDPYAWISAF
ncbi:Harbinger transposase-derived nuclease [Corchorus capsularis]|uniref:Harbinger transposase-derived nuclease n=1 Tax=Corchorus capsularis TaxID=210143 RepID=A0A1R3HC95_COCAP|nr:Harbinger transposase-derived nuclease [Corchorus capsularis]